MHAHRAGGGHMQETTKALAEAPAHLSESGLAFRVFLTAAAGDPTRAHGYAHQLQVHPASAPLHDPLFKFRNSDLIEISIS
jgi:hypothetical protein